MLQLATSNLSSLEALPWAFPTPLQISISPERGQDSSKVIVVKTKRELQNVLNFLWKFTSKTDYKCGRNVEAGELLCNMTILREIILKFK